MRDQLLWIETILRAAVAAALIIAPKTSIVVLGLPRTPDTFWPRLVGAIFAGLAFAAYAEGHFKPQSGLGLGGAVAVNIAVAFALLTALVVGGLAVPRRGRLLMWALTIAFIGLALFEIAAL